MYPNNNNLLVFITKNESKKDKIDAPENTFFKDIDEYLPIDEYDHKIIKDVDENNNYVYILYAKNKYIRDNLVVTIEDNKLIVTYKLPNKYENINNRHIIYTYQSPYGYHQITSYIDYDADIHETTAFLEDDYLKVVIPKKVLNKNKIEE